MTERAKDNHQMTKEYQTEPVQTQSEGEQNTSSILEPPVMSNINGTSGERL